MNNGNGETPLGRGSCPRNRKTNQVTAVANGWSRSPDYNDLLKVHGARTVSVPRPESFLDTSEKEKAQ